MGAKIFLAAAFCAIPVGAFGQSPDTSAPVKSQGNDQPSLGYGN